MAIRIIYPQGMTSVNWCNQMSLALSSVSQFPVVKGENDWRHWGESVARQVSLSQYKIPFPNTFKTWRAWADKFVQALSEVPI
jgi:hypothetical protein